MSDYLVNKSDWFTENLVDGVLVVGETKYDEDVRWAIIIADGIAIDAGSAIANPRNLPLDLVEYVLVTHGHEDHIGYLNVMPRIPIVYCSSEKYDKENIENGMKQGINFIPLQSSFFHKDFQPEGDLSKFEIKGYKKIQAITPNVPFVLNGNTIIPFKVAGHTPGGLVYYFKEKGWIFFGDNFYIGPMVFNQKESKPPYPTFKTFITDFNAVFEFLQHEESLGKDIKIFPGHNDDVLTMDELRKFHYALNHLDEAVITIEDHPVFGKNKKYDFSHILDRLSFLVSEDFTIED